MGNNGGGGKGGGGNNGGSGKGGGNNGGGKGPKPHPCSPAHFALYLKLANLKGTPVSVRTMNTSPTVQFKMSDGSTATMMSTPSQQNKVKVLKVTLANGKGGKCEDKKEIPKSIAETFKSLTKMEANCKNAFTQLGKYGFKCTDNLAGLFGVSVSLKDLCCATCTRKDTTAPAKTTTKT